MTTTTIDRAAAPMTLTLTRQQWDTIRIACLCASVDSSQSEPDWSRMAGNAYTALRDAMGA
jgi:hypothetical protein